MKLKLTKKEMHDFLDEEESVLRDSALLRSSFDNEHSKLRSDAASMLHKYGEPDIKFKSEDIVFCAAERFVEISNEMIDDTLSDKVYNNAVFIIREFDR